MLEITSLNRGIVIDHIKPGLGIKIFNLLHLDELEDEVALILNANSTSQEKKDIVKIANNLDINYRSKRNSKLYWRWESYWKKEFRITRN